MLCCFVLGQSLTGCRPGTYTYDKDGSIGRPSDGRLRSGEQLLPRDGIQLNAEDRSWGTEETISLMNLAIDRVQEKYPDTCDMFIGDISRRKGGRLRPHISHKSGRDIDVSYYAHDNRFIRFIPMNVNNLDVEKTWYFLETLLLTERVTLILMDYRLQKVFYGYLETIYPKRILRHYFQYPRKTGNRRGIIRHAPGHMDHLHIRFKCPKEDDYCEEW